MPLPDEVLNRVLVQLAALEVAPIAVWSFDSDGIVNVKLANQDDLDTVAGSDRLPDCDLTVMEQRP